MSGDALKIALEDLVAGDAWAASNRPEATQELARVLGLDAPGH